MVSRYDSVITIIDESKMIALKFKIVDNHLYAYNMYNAVENRKFIKVSKINGIDISNVINSINENDLYDVTYLKKLV